jgi:hypothetical protein
MVQAFIGLDGTAFDVEHNGPDGLFSHKCCVDLSSRSSRRNFVWGFLDCVVADLGLGHHQKDEIAKLKPSLYKP